MLSNSSLCFFYESWVIMIYDSVKNVGRYKGMSRWLDVAIDFLEKTDLTTLPIGRTEICEDKVFANVMEAQARDEEEIRFEIHKRYMDIQIDVEGTEVVQFGIEANGVLDPYNEDTDFGTVDCEKSASCVLGKGRFVVCMGEEPHKPSIAENENRYLKKCVIKVAV